MDESEGEREKERKLLMMHAVQFHSQAVSFWPGNETSMHIHVSQVVV